jgi:hypothetical protein
MEVDDAPAETPADVEMTEPVGTHQEETAVDQHKLLTTLLKQAPASDAAPQEEIKSPESLGADFSSGDVEMAEEIKGEAKPDRVKMTRRSNR